jgi:hypothetical protein
MRVSGTEAVSFAPIQKTANKRERYACRVFRLRIKANGEDILSVQVILPPSPPPPRETKEESAGHIGGREHVARRFPVQHNAAG